MSAKVQACLFISRFGNEHPISSFLSAAGFGNHDAKSSIQIRANGCQDAIHSVRVGIIKKEGLDFIATRITQGVRDKLGPECRATDPNQ